jgi:dTDP-4-dehydrorhamnose reductase
MICHVQITQHFLIYQTTMRILLTGKNGHLGWELYRQLVRDHKVLAIGREDIDFLDSKFLSSVMRELPVLDLIVNAAAYTNIDKAEQEPFIAEAINSEAVARLAVEADYRGIPMIHFSTDSVFGRHQRTIPYREEDQPNPLSVYGWSKLEGELRMRNIVEKHWIFRLSGLYGTRHENFFTTICANYRKGVISHVADDHVVSPNWTSLVAEAVAGAVKRLLRGEKVPWGVYHLSGSGSTTWYRFARLISEKINDLWGSTMPHPVSATERTEKRLKYSVLDPTRFNTTFQHHLPDWQDQFLHFFGGLQPNP